MSRPQRFGPEIKEMMMIKAILYTVGFFALIGILVVAGCFKVVF